MAKKIQTVYLAGPDVFYPNAKARFEQMRALVMAAGFEPITPLDGELHEIDPTEVMAREIYATNIARLRQADAVIANLTPFRGVGADPGTAFEVGFAAALRKPVFAYMDVPDESEADHRDRVETYFGAVLGPDEKWRDHQEVEIEDFGLPENLMLWCEARRLMVIIGDDPHTSLTGLELSLEGLASYVRDWAEI